MEIGGLITASRLRNFGISAKYFFTSDLFAKLAIAGQAASTTTDVARISPRFSTTWRLGIEPAGNSKKRLDNRTNALQYFWYLHKRSFNGLGHKDTSQRLFEVHFFYFIFSS